MRAKPKPAALHREQSGRQGREPSALADSGIAILSKLEASPACFEGFVLAQRLLKSFLHRDVLKFQVRFEALNEPTPNSHTSTPKQGKHLFWKKKEREKRESERERDRESQIERDRERERNSERERVRETEREKR
jgi:hypothetical protein